MTVNIIEKSDSKCKGNLMINVVVTGKVQGSPTKFAPEGSAGGSFVIASTVWRDKARQQQKFICYYAAWQQKTVDRIVKNDALLVVVGSDVDVVPDAAGQMSLALSVSSIDFAG